MSTLATIKLTRFGLEDDLVASFPLEIKAEGTNIPSAVFVYHWMLPAHGPRADRFECVASLQQMSLLPAGEILTSTTEKQIPYYRMDTVLFDCATASEAQRVWENVQSDVNSLVRQWNARAELQEKESVVCEGN